MNSTIGLCNTNDGGLICAFDATSRFRGLTRSLSAPCHGATPAPAFGSGRTAEPVSGLPVRFVVTQDSSRFSVGSPQGASPRRFTSTPLSRETPEVVMEELIHPPRSLRAATSG